ncbi:N4-gp56 family major capsid protein [Streptomyces sp. UNOC14_S4]|uniref:N4-gp56 family major capsid protein n=1 Tax=Streptomyces sp. UNOC14_S4 TaxID=2872340 RepID=UPI001E29AC92|nr:N4-gp56 family major capsid protein [Streptomyces sp. UNOC14_S4]MCC3766059.1 N4-gp56 family major capsid protein [Streptomyces sp. UNOC14_S4]
MASAITGTGFLSPNPTNYTGPNSQLTPAIQQIWSKEILFQSMPILRYEAFAVKKTELGVSPGLTIQFMRYDNLKDAKQLTEGIHMETQALTASQFSVSVHEHGAAVAVSELLLNASFDDVMASASRLLGRNMAIYLDGMARDVLLGATSVLYGRDKFDLSGAKATRTRLSPFDKGDAAAGRDGLTSHYLTASTVKDGVETLASKNIPRLGDTYVMFVHPHQSRWLREDPAWINATSYAQPGNFSIGEIGRIDDTIFVETTQVRQLQNSAGKTVYQSSMIGDNAFAHAISLPVELRDGGVIDMGREHRLGWYSVLGMGLITDQSVVTIETN